MKAHETLSLLWHQETDRAYSTAAWGTWVDNRRL